MVISVWYAIEEAHIVQSSPYLLRIIRCGVRVVVQDVQTLISAKSLFIDHRTSSQSSDTHEYNIMVTGIEIAGVALAVFPIVLNGLSSLRYTARKIKNLRRYRRCLGRVVRQLDMERGKFVNTCTNILGDMVTEERLSGSGWKDPEFQERLKKRLGRRTAKVFRKLMHSMTSTLDDLKDELELDKNNKVSMYVISLRRFSQWHVRY